MHTLSNEQISDSSIAKLAEQQHITIKRVESRYADIEIFNISSHIALIGEDQIMSFAFPDGQYSINYMVEVVVEELKKRNN